MAVSHVAPESKYIALLHELLTSTGFQGRVAEGNVIAFNAHHLTVESVGKLIKFKKRFSLPMSIKRVGAGLRVTFGKTALSVSDSGFTFKNQTNGFNVSFLNNENVNDLFEYVETWEQPISIKRSGTGLRITYEVRSSVVA